LNIQYFPLGYFGCRDTPVLRQRKAERRAMCSQPRNLE
jgi:hypothetical protein